jgi:AraC family transcriptional regulator
LGRTPPLDDPGQGQFHGQVVGRHELESSVMVLTTPSASARPFKGKHYHEHPYFWMSLDGDCSEIIEGREERVYDPFVLTYHPSGEVHEHRRGAVAPTGFGIVLIGEMFERARQFAPIEEVPQVFQGPEFSSLAHLILREFKNSDTASIIALDALALELIVCASRASRPRESTPPRWLQLAKELIHARYLERLTLSEIAATVGVHPAHFTSTFRTFYGCTPGQLIRRLRIEHSRRLLAKHDLPVAQIAVSCGFYDEAHFCKAFRAMTGATPTEFRRESN